MVDIRDQVSILFRIDDQLPVFPVVNRLALGPTHGKLDAAFGCLDIKVQESKL